MVAIRTSNFERLFVSLNPQNVIPSTHRVFNFCKCPFACLSLCRCALLSMAASRKLRAICDAHTHTVTLRHSLHAHTKRAQGPCGGTGMSVLHLGVACSCRSPGGRMFETDRLPHPRLFRRVMMMMMMMMMMMNDCGVLCTLL